MVIRALALAAVLALAAAPALAERPKAHFVKACGLTGSAGSVVVDVYDDDAPGALLDTIPNGEVARVGTTDCYTADLAATTASIGYPQPEDPEEHNYTLVFRDDGGNEVYLSERVAGVVGDFDACRHEVPVYATQPIPERGITAQTIAEEKPSYFRVELDCGGDFQNPEVTYYWIFEYDPSGRVADRTSSLTPPNP